jgi:hypothetical protein
LTDTIEGVHLWGTLRVTAPVVLDGGNGAEETLEAVGTGEALGQTWLALGLWGGGRGEEGSRALAHALAVLGCGVGVEYERRGA